MCVDHTLYLASLDYRIECGKCICDLDDFGLDGLSRCWCGRRDD